MSCTTCFEAIIAACSANIFLEAGLLPNTSYYWLITSPSGKIYQRQVNTDGQGKLTIELSMLPTGAANPHAGFYSLELREGANYLNTVSLTLGGKTYDCVQFRFVEVDAVPENPFNTIK